MKLYATVSLNTLHKNMQKLLHSLSTSQQPAQINRVVKDWQAVRTTPKTVAYRLLAMALIIAAVGAVAAPKIYADTLQDQIDQLQQEASHDQSAVDGLLLQAKDYQDAIGKLQSQIDVVEQNIAVNQARQTDLQHQIHDKQVQLDTQRKVLGDDIKAMYVDGQLSTIEMLATSRNLTDFVDTATYRESVQRKVQTTLAEIAKLQNELQGQKQEIDKLLKAQQLQEEQLASDRAKQNELLAYNSAQRDTYNQKINANQDKIRELQTKQAALNQQGASRVNISGDERGGACDSGSGNGGYRLAAGPMGDPCDAAKDAILDWAGIENRECTSYAYWYFKRVEGFSDFTASGDAKYWVTTSNYPVHSWPRAGAIGVKTDGQWGHVTIVQAVGPSNYKGVNVPAGQVLTSEMNADLTGKYSYSLRGIGSMSYIYK
jgi:peptidoglycan hydrolase CwlO-like protein